MIVNNNFGTWYSVIFRNDRNFLVCHEKYSAHAILLGLLLPCENPPFAKCCCPYIVCYRILGKFVITGDDFTSGWMDNPVGKVFSVVDGVHGLGLTNGVIFWWALVM